MTQLHTIVKARPASAYCYPDNNDNSLPSHDNNSLPCHDNNTSSSHNKNTK